MKKILVVGSANLDIVCEVERMPQIGETVAGAHIEKFAGGKGLNQAVASARMAVPTYFLGSMGVGSSADYLKSSCKDNNLNLDYLANSTMETGTAIITLCQQNNTIIVIPSANDEVTIEYIKAHLDLFTKEVIVVLQNEIKQEVNAFIIDYCYQEGIEVIYNPAPARSVSADLIDKITYMTPNETEAALLFGTDNIERIVEMFPNKVIVTLGAKGVCYCDGKALVHYLPPVMDVVDTTGAGDTLSGILAAGLAKGEPLSKALQRAVYGATLSTTKKGAQSAMPTVKEVADEKAWYLK